jgi:threonine dehydratase
LEVCLRALCPHCGGDTVIGCVPSTLWRRHRHRFVCVCGGGIAGGGLIGGIATAIKGRWPDILVVGAEPQGADDAFRSKAEGVRLPHR